MATSSQTVISLFYKPEYIALLISVIAITANVYISWRNRKYALAKEEYFKRQQVVEKIISKLLILQTHRLKLKTFFELSFKANQNKNSQFIDANDTFNKDNFEKDGEEITTFIYLYFNEVGEEWNFCLNKMSELFTRTFILDKRIKNNETINWEDETKNYNQVSQGLADRPNEIGERLKLELKKFKENNL